MSDYGWHPYVPVAERRRQAERKLAKLKKQGQSIAPVKIEGRAIATSFWGKAWCDNLERYSDYANRLPRGRTYARNGSIVDLQISGGVVTAMVAGSELYQVRISVGPVKPACWKSVCRDCTGTIDSLVELLQGRLAKGVMDRVCREGDGLFPSPAEIKLSCSCPDWADMCKHVAAVLYGVGARLDLQPQLLFVLRKVDENDLLAAAGEHAPLTRTASGTAKRLDEGDIADVFGLEMAETTEAVVPAVAVTKSPKRPKAGKAGKAPAVKTKAAVRKKSAATSTAAHRVKQSASKSGKAIQAGADKRSRTFA